MILKVGIGFDAILFGFSEQQLIDHLGEPDKRYTGEEGDVTLQYNRFRSELTIEMNHWRRFGWLSEVTASYTSVDFSNDGSSFDIQHNFGVQAAYGVSDDIELRARFEYIRVGFAFGSGIDKSSTTQFHPTLLLTASGGKSIEFNTSAKALIYLEEPGNRDVLFALNLGLGLSSDTSKWALRPEIGFLFNPGEEVHYTHVSIGLSVKSHVQ